MTAAQCLGSLSTLHPRCWQLSCQRKELSLGVGVVVGVVEVKGAKRHS
jgi:hypothetical protein